MWHSKIVSLLINFCVLAVFFGPAPAKAALDKKVLKLVNKAVFEVVVRKPPEDAITYERPLPLDLLRGLPANSTTARKQTGRRSSPEKCRSTALPISKRIQRRLPPSRRGAAPARIYSKLRCSIVSVIGRRGPTGSRRWKAPLTPS